MESVPHGALFSCPKGENNGNIQTCRTERYCKLDGQYRLQRAIQGGVYASVHPVPEAESDARQMGYWGAGLHTVLSERCL